MLSQYKQKSDIFNLEDLPVSPRKVVDRNRSNIFNNEEPSLAKPARVNRLASNIFFQDYVPSPPSAPRRTEKVIAPVEEQMQSFVPSTRITNRDPLKSNVFEAEAAPAKGARRHYGPGQHQSDIFHQGQETPKPKRVAPVEASLSPRSASFSNIFGHVEDSYDNESHSPQVQSRVGGLSSNDLNRQPRGKGRQFHSNQSQIWF